MIKDEMLVEAEYTKIIYSTVNYIKTISITQVVFSSFCFKRCMSSGDNLGHFKYNVFEKSLGRLRTQFLIYKDDFRIIFDVINILRKTGYLEIDNGNVSITEKRIKDLPVIENKHAKMLSEIRKMNDAWFLEEIINYV